jgi:hypothetical protein
VRRSTLAAYSPETPPPTAATRGSAGLWLCKPQAQVSGIRHLPALSFDFTAQIDSLSAEASLGHLERTSLCFLCVDLLPCSVGAEAGPHLLLHRRVGLAVLISCRCALLFLLQQSRLGSRCARWGSMVRARPVLVLQEARRQRCRCVACGRGSRRLCFLFCLVSRVAMDEAGHLLYLCCRKCCCAKIRDSTRSDRFSAAQPPRSHPYPSYSCRSR